jgi:chromatin segregation and condensation protein Rec8/ScpA/Scc1 (kleisin family)
MSTSEADHLVLRLEGFEGPLDLLLDLARAEGSI